MFVALIVSCGTAFAAPHLIVDMKSGKVLSRQQEFDRWYPASLTKLMTTYVVFRAIQAGEVSFSSPVRISKKASQLPPSKMAYKPGSELTIDNALKIIMVKSANDVAASLGESVAGSVPAFADRMNAESLRLGMTDSHWVNPHGLHDDDQFSSPRDLAILATALRRDFRQYSDYFSIEGLLADGKEIPNHNNLIGRYEGADGMKTGYTCPSGFNLVASASRNGRTLLAVVLGGESVAARDAKSAAMLSRGFASAPGSGPALGELKRTSPGSNMPTNMFDELCSKEARAARAKKAKELQAAIKAGRAAPPVPALSEELPRKRRLVTVKLGGAQGPVPASVQRIQAQADVPIPTWRPDMPPPIVKTSEQGDAAASVQ
jgi:D-alanyl-D-alanine carboxypeptidase